MEPEAEAASASSNLGFISLCSLAAGKRSKGKGQGQETGESERIDRSDRSICFRVGSGACVAVVPKNHRATRWPLAATGSCRTARRAVPTRPRRRRPCKTRG